MGLLVCIATFVFFLHSLAEGALFPGNCLIGVNDVFAHPQSCESYIQCVNGQAFQHECPPGLYYSDTKNACDYRQNVNCLRNSNSKCPAGYTDNTVIDPSFQPCPANLPIVFLYPNWCDCKTFYVCSKGEISLVNCENGKYYNPLFYRCDIKSQSPCCDINAAACEP